ncbi:N-formylglutamate amidohydrolase [Fulvimarina sp. 2208YS6-2-32]|uniref:N-formylglutamate amidohydrolase n=1 Tax=Fulvimarina uroteuthidis TaxID=3098149 RepID=A0ABU5HZG2_9HYPH|nr:N-formylglutamate amidohydrolase [Fulvimarina sp. 2208YS6-2-32]MDY8108511.1 N-formylglutamate amidohydrolase [Fulvimarina sp. 2208YS6-2-32]
MRRPAACTTPLIFCSPHGGRDYPASFLDRSRLPTDAIRRSEDLYVEELYRFVETIGAPLISARFPRAFLDVNREPYELDPAMFEGELPLYVNSHSVRVAGGLGTIPKIVAENTEIYRDKITVEEGLARIDTYHHSFHAAISGLIAETKRIHGMAILIDCHSMPSSVRPAPGGRRPDIIIGDRYGTSAAARLVSFVTSGFSREGYDVMRNKPYAGGYITERYGKPAIGEHALQVEISRALYADEAHFRQSEDFPRLEADLRSVFGWVAHKIRETYPHSIAAE